MYKYFSSIVFLIVIGFFGAQAQHRSAYDQLVKVNREWLKQNDADPALKVTPATELNEQQLIQLHLAETEKLLRKRNIAGLSPVQVQNREKLLKVLHEYRLAGVFPVNTMHMGRQPYFIDQYDTYCAVGYLMKESGADDMARAIKKTQNYNYLTDINHPQLMHWVEQSGLTLDELALIQPGYGGEWLSAIVEMHYNNIGTDENEYIEIHGGNHLFLDARFETVLFYDAAGTLYKTLNKAQMQIYYPGATMYYYHFPAGEDFADEGRIELRAATNVLISTTTYTANSIQVVDNLAYAQNQGTRFWAVGENNTTPLGYSITFCGFYNNSTWMPQNTLATPGTANPCTIMPLGLKSFSGTTNGKMVNLKWETIVEQNSRSFIIERSTDGNHFESLATVAAAGNASMGRAYTYADLKPGYINHYRLRLVDNDGKMAYSEIVYIKVEKASAIELLENIITTRLSYRVSPAFKASRLEVYDINGRRIYQGIPAAGTGYIHTTGWAPGKYVLMLLTTQGESFSSQFVKQ